MVPPFMVQLAISVGLAFFQVTVKNLWIKKTKNHAANMKNAQSLAQEIYVAENSLITNKERIKYNQGKLDDIGATYAGRNMKISVIMFVINRILSTTISKYVPKPQPMYSPFPIPGILRPIVQRGINPKETTEYMISSSFYGLLVNQSICGLISRLLLIQTPRAGFGQMSRLAKGFGYSNEQIKQYEQLMHQYMGF